jgi:hypothetical protein
MIIGEDDDDELIDEDTLLTEEDLKRPVNIRECSVLLDHLYFANGWDQLPSAPQELASVVEHAKTAPVGLLRRLPLKMQQSDRMPTRSSRPSSLVRMTLLK